MDDSKQLILDLIEHASTDNHTKFERLRYSSEYLAGRVTRRAIKLTVSNLQYSADKLFKKYCKAVTTQHADVSMLLAYVKLQHAVKFYEVELKLINEVLDDYENYLAEGNFINAFVLDKERDY